MFIRQKDELWAGTEASLLALDELEERLADILAEAIATGKTADLNADNAEEPNRLLTVHGNVGVISVKGSLVNSDAWFLRYIGATGYPEIQGAISEAADNPAITHIVLDVNSGGGSVSGVMETADMLKQVGKIKPVTTYADGMMASAAYWLGATGKKIFASPTADVGSIGVLQRHVEYSKQMEQEGVKGTIIRAGKYKALANPIEPLSKDAKDQMQAGVDHVYGIFVQHVADSRGVTYAHADATMAQGREFVGEQAKAAGLVDGISSFDAVLADAQKAAAKTTQKSVDNRFPKLNNMHGEKAGENTSEAGEAPMKRKTLTPETRAAIIAAGGNPDAEVNAPAAEAGNADGTGLTAPEVAPAAPEAAAPTAVPEAAAPGAPEVKPEGEVVAFLRGELKDAHKQITDLSIENKSAIEKVAAMESTHNALVAIATGAVNNMRVALGLSKIADGMNAEQLVTEHGTRMAEFQTKFPVGGVSAAVTVNVTEKAGKVDHARVAGMVNATRFSQTNKGK